MKPAHSITLGEVTERVETWSPTRTSGTFEYIDLTAIDQTTKVIAGSRRLEGRLAPTRARQRVQADDILVSTVRPNLNAVARVPEHLDGATASTGFCVLRPDIRKLDAAYLFHWVRSPEFVAHLVSRSTGATYPAVSDRTVLESRLPLPTISTQQRIADVLDRADALRVKRRAALAEVDELQLAAFRSTFGDLSNAVEWTTQPLGALAEILSGITVGRKLNGESTRSVPYLAVANVQDRRLSMTRVKTIEATEDEIQRYRLAANDLLITEGGDPDKLGRGTLWHAELGECIHQNHIFRVRLVTKCLHPVFLNWLIGSSYGKSYFLKAAKQTTGIASINLRQLKAFPTLVPPIGLQQEFARQIEEIGRVRSLQAGSAAEMGLLFASLQQRAFAGEL